MADIDTAIAHGPGLRWAVMGPFMNLHLSGGAGGIEHLLAHLGGPIEDWWKDLGAPIDDGRVDAAGGRRAWRQNSARAASPTSKPPATPCC